MGNGKCKINGKYEAGNGKFLLLLLISCFLFPIFLLSSCGYKLQTRADLPFEAVRIGSIDNRTHEPKMEDRLNKILAETFMEYGFRIDRAAGHTVEVEITGFRLRTLSEKDLTASEYETLVHARYRVVDSGKAGAAEFSEIRSPFVTYFGVSGRLEGVLARKEQSINDALKNLSQEIVRRISYKEQTGSGK